MNPDATLPLRGRRVVTTRDEPGELDRLLAEAGATVVHVPMIEVTDAADGGAALAKVLDSLADVDWVIVTSRHGAVRVGSALAAHPHIRLAAVGTRTASELTRLTGRNVDVMPARQTGADLLLAMPDGHGESVVIAQAGRADPTLSTGLANRGYRVRTVVAYDTSLRRPSRFDMEEALTADAVAFASGSAANGWAEAIGVETPECVVAIGPTTAAAARASGIRVTHVASEHSVPGLLRAIVDALNESGATDEPRPTHS